MSQRTGSDVETEQLGAKLVATLCGGDVVLLKGDLGAGKTTFVRGFARAVGAADQVSSPTFTIGQRYRVGADPGPLGGDGHGLTATDDHRSFTEIAHLDLYRLKTTTGEDPDLLADYIDSQTVTFVEWPEVAESELRALAARVIEVTFTHRGPGEREIEIR